MDMQQTYAASEKRYPTPVQKPYHAPPDQRDIDQALDLQTAFEEGAEWAFGAAVESIKAALQKANDDVHDDLCACAEYPEACVTYGKWADRMQVERLYLEDIEAAVKEAS